MRRRKFCAVLRFTAPSPGRWCSDPLPTLVLYFNVIEFACNRSRVTVSASARQVRRQKFELFYYSHHFFLVLWAVVLWHAASAWYYIGASIALWIVDRAIRFSK